MDVRNYQETVAPFSLNGRSILFLDRHAAESPQVSKRDAYRAASRLFHCGLLDRTGTLDSGFDANIIDPIEKTLQHSPISSSFEELCDLRAQEIVEEASTSHRPIQLLWSGGIDSTVALIALMKVLKQQKSVDRLQVLCSVESISEYPAFFYQHLWQKLNVRAVGYPVSEYLDRGALIVTGEHGDQLFGSDFLRPYVDNGLAFEDWSAVFPFVMAAHGIRDETSVGLRDYLRPLMQSCPRQIVSLFDFFWWLNFSCKWQSVSLRIPAHTNLPGQSFDRTRHFFRSLDFQHWSLFQHDFPKLDSWRDYKMPSKDYIYSFTNDATYREEKTKEPSLRLVFAGEPQRRKSNRRPQAEPSSIAENDARDDHQTGLVITGDFVASYIQSA